MALPAAKISSPKWLLFMACVIFGTLLGIFFQHFSSTAPIFKNIVDFKIGVKEVDLLVLSFGFDFALKMNLGTLVGGVVGLLFIR
jgi:hypothetical protein